jgi:hypothetical protein
MYIFAPPISPSSVGAPSFDVTALRGCPMNSSVFSWIKLLWAQTDSVNAAIVSLATCRISAQQRGIHLPGITLPTASTPTKPEPGANDCLPAGVATPRSLSAPIRLVDPTARGYKAPRFAAARAGGALSGILGAPVWRTIGVGVRQRGQNLPCPR